MIRFGIGIPSRAQRAVNPILAGGDFSADTVGALASTRGFTFARASTATTYDETAGTVTTGVGVDAARAAKSSAGRVGLLVEPVRTNKVDHARSCVGAPWSAGTLTDVASATAGPDGVSSAQRTHGASGGYSRYFNHPDTHTVGDYFTESAWYKSNSGAADPHIRADVFATRRASTATLSTSVWKRRSQTNTYTSTSASCDFFFVDAFAGNVDVFHDFRQVEDFARWASSVINTTGASATRAADKLSVAESSVEAAGALRFYCKLEVPSTLLNHTEAGGTGELTLWTDAAGSYKCWIDASSGAIYAQALASDLGIPAAVYTTSSPVSVAANDLLEVWIVCGGAALPTIKYRVNGGSVVTPTLSSGTRTHTLTGIGATVHVLGDSTGANGLYGIVQSVAFYADGQAPGGF